MSKDSTQVLTAGPSSNLWLAPVATAEPAAVGTAFSASWVNMGYLLDPPAVDRALSKTEVPAWNASEPLRTLLDSDVSTVLLKLEQTNRAVFELYFGPLTYTTEGGGVSITPTANAADVEKALCVELIDGSNILRVFWRRCAIDSVGGLSMDKAAAITYEVTMKRLVPQSGDAYRIQTNVLGLTSA